MALLAEGQQRLEAPLARELESQLVGERQRPGTLDARPILHAAHRYQYI